LVALAGPARALDAQGQARLRSPALETRAPDRARGGRRSPV